VHEKAFRDISYPRSPPSFKRLALPHCLLSAATATLRLLQRVTRLEASAESNTSGIFASRKSMLLRGHLWREI